MNLDIIAKIINDSDLAAENTDLFLHHMPDDVEQGVLVRNPLQGNPINHYIPGYMKGSLQVVCRALTYEKGTALSTGILNLLNIEGSPEYTDDDGNTMTINFLRPRTLPIVYPRLPGNTIEWSIIFDACYLLAVPFS